MIAKQKKLVGRWYMSHVANFALSKVKLAIMRVLHLECCLDRTNCVEYPAEVKDTFDIDVECRMKVLKVEISLVLIILVVKIIAGKKLITVARDFTFFFLQWTNVNGDKRLYFVTLLAGVVASFGIGLGAMPYWTLSRPISADAWHVTGNTLFSSDYNTLTSR